jgi:hypothetical protein
MSSCGRYVRNPFDTGEEGGFEVSLKSILQNKDYILIYTTLYFRG